MNILLVEDDRRIAVVVKQALTEEGHHVDTLASGQEAEHHILTMPYNVAVLDLMLPERDGFEILRRVRGARSTVPILVLSARDAVSDVVRALDLGADDYVTKPFHLEMLLARVRSVSRRGPVSEPAQLAAAGLVLDPSRRELTRDGETISLTRREFALLEQMMRRANKVVTREQLIEAGWGLSADVLQNSLEFHIHSLRSKIDVNGQPSLIRTVRAMGYRFGA
jgi:two-component system copper resistance phosphate regulon response regulator CusR